MKTMSLYLSCVLVILFGGVACQSSSPESSGLGVESITNEIPPATYLRVDNAKLAEEIDISDVKHRRVNDLLEVNIELSSQVSKSMALQYQFNWFDAQGFVVASQKSSWHPIALHGHQSTMVRGVAPSAEVTTFNVYLRQASSALF